MLVKFADDTKLRTVSPTRNKRTRVKHSLSGWNAVIKQKRIKLMGCN